MAVPLQGANVPWAALRDLGVVEAGIRAQVGNNAPDARVGEVVRAAKSEGIAPFPYLFLFSLPQVSPIVQANLFLRAILEAGGDHYLGAGKGEVGPALDLEWPPPEQWAARGCSSQQIADHALTALEQIEHVLGIEPEENTVYGYPWFFDCLAVGVPGLCKGADKGTLWEFARRRLWIAGGPGYLNGKGLVPDLSKEKPPTTKIWGPDAWWRWQHDGNGGLRLPNGVDADFNVLSISREEFDAVVAHVHDDSSMGPDSSPTDPVIVDMSTLDLLTEDGIGDYRRSRGEG